MNGVIDTLNFTNSNNEISNLYPRTLVEAITNKDGETLESLLSNGTGGGTSVAASDHQFTICGKNLETGWYRIAKVPDGNRPCIVSLIDSGNFDDGYTYAEATVFCDFNYGNVKVHRCKSDYDGLESYVGFDGFNFESGYDSDTDTYFNYLCIHYTNPGHTDQTYTITVTSVYTGEMDWGDGCVLSQALYPLENKIEPVGDVNNMPTDFNEFDLNANVDIVTTEDLKDIGSSHQYMLYYEGVLETGWYIIGCTMGVHSCNINIIDMGTMPGEEMPILVQANVLSTEYTEAAISTVKILDFSTYEGCAPYVGFDKIVTTRTEDGDIVVVMHYTNPGFEDHNCILTITSLMGGELTFDDYSVNFGMQPYDGNTLTYLCDEFAEDALVGQVREFELKAPPNLADILARLEALEAKGVSDILDPEGVEF